MGCRNIRFPRWVSGEVWAFCSSQLIWNLTWPFSKEMFSVPRPHLWPPLQIPSGCWKCWSWHSRWSYFFLVRLIKLFSCQADHTFFLSGWSYWCWWKSPDRVAPVNPDQPWRDPNLLATLTIKYQIYFFGILKKRDSFQTLNKNSSYEVKSSNLAIL